MRYRDLKLGRVALSGTILAVGGLLAAGCSSSTTTSTATQPSNTSAAASPTGGAGSSLASEVPASIKAKGTITVAADATYAPDEFVQPGSTTVVGMDADLAAAIGKALGLKVNVVNATFDSIIPGLQAGKYDLGMSSFTDTKQREQVVDFVTYFSAGTSFYERTSGGPAINGLADLCGHKVAVEKGTTEQSDATTQSGVCTKAGKPAVQVQTYPDQNGANLALQSGRADVGMADSPVAAYQVKQSNGAFKLVGQAYGTAPYGIAIPKGNGMAQAVLDAVKQLMANGTYTQILTTWGLQSGAITNPVTNGATS
jgi:polar amino acid transport system substrate-binding protein